jgi:imipenem/basic amino acid-specific outer membrane pore
MKRTFIAFAMAAGGIAPAFASSQSESNGFVADSTLTLTNRNYYFNHDNKNGVKDGRDWMHAVQGNFVSGFTRGRVGFGLDAFAYGALKLDAQGAGTANAALLGNGDTGSFSHVGGALKLRVASSVLQYGDLRPSAPIFAAGGWNILPQSAEGFQLLSRELDGLALEAGHFTAGTGGHDSGNHGPILATYANIETKAVDYLGGTYTLSPELSVALYGSQFKDLWHQYYGSFQLARPLGAAQSLSLNGHLYYTTNHGRAIAGRIDNTAWSLDAAYAFGSHTLTLAYQQIEGDVPFDYAGFGKENATGDSVILANSILVSDFNGPGERSLQLRYDFDLSDCLLPGLGFMVRYIYGGGVDGRHADPGGAYANHYGHGDQERELNVEVKYVVPDGPAKDFTIRFQQGWHTGAASLNGDTNQFRLMVEYPLSLR